MASKKKPTDLTTQILIQIRDEIRQTNERLERLERRQTDSETRLATELVALAKAVNDVRVLIIDMRQDQRRMEALEERVLHVERKVS